MQVVRRRGLPGTQLTSAVLCCAKEQPMIEALVMFSAGLVVYQLVKGETKKLVKRKRR